MLSPPDFGSAPTVLLHLLQRGVPCDVALIGSLEAGRLVVEDIWPPVDGMIGRALRLPAGFAEDRTVLLDTAAVRLPLDWTQLSGGRPAYVAAAPVEPGSTYLLLAGRGEARPVHAELDQVATAIGRLLGTGQTLRRDRDTSERIRALVDNLPAPMVFIDSRLGEMALNDPARALLGIADASASPSRIAAALRSLVASASGDLSTRLLADPRCDFRLDLPFREKVYEVESRWIEEHRLAGRLWMFHDVTSERDAARFKDELVSNVSHELRTPLTSIVGALGLLKGGAVAALPADAVALIDIAHNNGERLARLVNNLLVMGKLEADRLEVRLFSTDMIALLVEAVALNRPYADRFGVRLDLRLPEGNVVAPVDADRMVQVMSNLLSNAVKFSAPGGVVEVVLAEQGSRVRISVIDHGCGMTADFQKRLFTRFEQERDSGVARSGTGLGLAISKGLVERLGGRIYVESAPDLGSTFHIDLPVAG